MYRHIRSFRFQVSAAAIVASIAALTFAFEFAWPVQAHNPPAAAGLALNVCVLDRSSIALADVNVASTKRLEDLSRLAQGEIDNIQQRLQAEYNTLNAEERTPVEASGKRAALDERAKALAKLVDIKRRQIEATKIRVSRQVAVAALPILQAVEKSRSCSLLLPRENILDSNGVTDITRQTLEAMNSRLRSMPFSLVNVESTPPIH